jgi:hypothetical protein
MSWEVQRKFPRVNVVVQAEVRRSLDNFPRRVQTTNMSEGGCYIEMLTTLEPFTRIDVVLWLNGEKVSARAEVVTNQPHLGNGIKFIQIKDADKQKLRDFMESAKKNRSFLSRTASSTND